MNILLLAGGESSEREVALDSSWAIYQSLVRLGHTVSVYDPASDRWGSPGRSGFDGIERSLPSVLLPCAFDPRQSQFQKFDLVVLGLHGGLGENGSIQTLLDLAGLPYTGSDRASSTVAMNKDLTKQLMKSADIPTPAWSLYRLDETDSLESIADETARLFEFPVIVKPADGGSTVGLTLVRGRADLVTAFERAGRESISVMAETYIEGHEITAAVLDGETLPLIEIIASSGLYDYESKYTKGRSVYIVPAGIDDTLAREIWAAAASLYRTIGASGVARVDFRLTEAGMFYCLELNTLPGMTELSLVPMAAKAAGMDFDSLMNRVIQSALRRKPTVWKS